MNANVEMNIGNNGNNQNERRNAAIQAFMNKMSQIPESQEVVSAMINDWVLNIGAEELQALTYEHIRELVEGIYQDNGRNPPGFTDDDYKQMFNFFTDFVREYHGPELQGGKRRRRRQSKKSRRKTRKSKKTRRHK